jgi:hypothetical protein
MLGKCPQCGTRVDTRLWWCTECGFAVGDKDAVLSADAVLEQDVWRDDDLLVLRLGAQLPDRCISTNEPADGGRIRVPLVWYPDSVRWAGLGGTLPFVIVAISLRKSATIDVPVSRRWRRERRQSAVRAWTLALMGLAVFLVGRPFGGLHTVNWPLMETVGVVRMTDTHVWLSGANRRYLAALPQRRNP